MNKTRKLLRELTPIVLSGILLLSLTGCAASTQPQEQSQAGLIYTARAEKAEITANLSKADTDASWDEAASTKIHLDGAAITVEGTGAMASGNAVTITTAGNYVVSGTLSDGQIVIDATKDDKVHLVLNGAEITNRTGAPIYAAQCDKLILTLADNTINTLTDGGASFAYNNVADEEPNAALFSKDDLTINGAGALTVNAGFNNGIGTKDDLVIVSGTLTVNAANHGLRGNDSVTIAGGSLSIMADNDGVQTNNTGDAALGWILVQGGTLEIMAGYDGMQADTMLSVTGGEIHITAGGGATGAQSVKTADTATGSFKGLKSTGDIQITGGSISVDSLDDSLHANGNATMSAGSMTLASGDDGIHADGNLVVSGGSINVTQSYEGLEAANITISGGTVDVVASDDGFNAAGGADESGRGGRFDRDHFAAEGNYSVTISGGQVHISAGGDGIDSNGTITISGGTVVSVIRSSPDNGGIDANGTMTFTGGEIVSGGSGTGSGLSSNSTQSYVFIDTGVAAGAEVTVRQNGQTLIAFTPTTNCQYLMLSSPQIASGQSYEVYSGATLLTTTEAGTGGTGMDGWGGGMGGPGKPGRGGFGN